MVRLLFAILALLLTAAVMLAAPPKAPPVAMPPKAPPVTINDSGVIVHAAPGVVAQRPFPSSTATTPGTTVPSVVSRSTSFPGGVQGAGTTTPVRWVIPGGTANCTSYG